MYDEDFPEPPDLDNGEEIPIKETFAKVTDCINKLENRSSLTCCASESSFSRRSSLMSPEKEFKLSDNSHAIQRHNSVVPSSNSFFDNKFSLNKPNGSEVNSLKKTIAINNLNNSTSLEIAEVATMNRMDLCTIDDIDFSQIPGYIKIPENVPQWKKYQLETKNKEAINAYLKAKELEEIERNKYGNIPQWKKELIIKKERQLIEQSNPTDSEEMKYMNLPQWKKDLLKKRSVSKD